MSNRLFTLFFCVLFFFGSGLPVYGARLTNADDAAGIGSNPGGAGVTIDFRDVDVRVIAKFISELTGKSFVFDKQVREKMTIFSATRVTPDEAYSLFESALKIHGLTTVPSKGVIKIVPGQKARTMDVEIRRRLPKEDRARDDRIVTQLVRLKHASATEISTLLNPLVNKQTGSIIAYQSGNTLVVTDYASNIDRLLRIISSVDVADEGTQLTVIPLEHASARDLSSELEQILRQTPGTQPKGRQTRRVDYKVVPDERTNHLIVMAGPSETRMIRQLARRLDIPARRGADNVHVIFLKYSVAEDLATVLKELTGGASASASSANKGAPARLPLQDNILISAEKTTNALIIRADRQDFLVLKDIIDKLDIHRSQVLVEGIIMEVSVDRTNALGAEWRALDTESSGRQVIGGTNLSGTSGQGLINQLASQPFAGPAGLVLGAAEGTITWGGTTFLNIGLLIQALEQDSDVNILSTPHLLTMDNQEARIVVGEERPFLKSSLSTTTGDISSAVTNTYEFKDLGLTLKIKPHITKGEFITLKIYQELKSFVSEAETGAVTSTKREAETTVLVKNKETVVIGGLISDIQRENKSQVPCLGDIPLLGWAFKRRAQASEKQNLLILIKPSIVRTEDELRGLTDEKLREHENMGPQAPGEKKEFPNKGINILKD